VRFQLATEYRRYQSAALVQGPGQSARIRTWLTRQ
jgi:hypothetical protein